MSKCSGEKCGNPGKMQCPTCQKLGIPGSLSFFCTQACFKTNWPSHKSLHAMFLSSQSAASTNSKNNGRTKRNGDSSGFQFSGKLRPHEITPQLTISNPQISKPDYADNGIPISEQQQEKSNSAIPIYTPQQIQGIRNACKIGREVLDVASSAIRVGMTTDEIDVIVHEACLERNAYPSPLNYYHFPKSVCTSVNEVICHGIPDKRPLEDGDVLNLDITVYVNGYHGDLNETFLVGENCDKDSIRLVETAFKCLQTAVEMVKPGTMYRELGKQISAVAQAQGFSVVKTYCGHGIGSLFHTAPTVPHYARNKAVGIMKPGHIFTIEPMINMGTWKDITWPDDWSAVTADGKRSAQFEHTILVTETGYEILTARQNEPKMTWDLAKVSRPIL